MEGRMDVMLQKKWLCLPLCGKLVCQSNFPYWSRHYNGNTTDPHCSHCQQDPQNIKLCVELDQSSFWPFRHLQCHVHLSWSIKACTHSPRASSKAFKHIIIFSASFIVWVTYIAWVDLSAYVRKILLHFLAYNYEPKPDNGSFRDLHKLSANNHSKIKR